MSINTQEEELYKILATIINFLSILGCCFNLLVTLLLKISENPLGKMVVALSLMDLIANSFALVEAWGISNGAFCQFIAFMQAFGFGGSIVWSCFFAHSYYMMHKRKNNKIIDSFLGRYLMISTCISTVLGIFIISINFMKIDNGRCVHNPDLKSFDWKSVLLLVLPSFGSVAFCLGNYLMARIKYKNSESMSIGKLLIYPSILAICYFPSVFKELYCQLTEKPSTFWIDLSVALLFYSQGLLNAFAYGLFGAIAAACRNTQCFKKSELKETLFEQSDSIDLFSDTQELYFSSS